MIKYRPDRNPLSLSIKDEQLFENMDDLKKYVHEKWCRIFRYIGKTEPLTLDQIVIGEITGDHLQIGWRNSRDVFVKNRREGFCGE
ncbi:MAG: hypothetical protein J6Y48_14940 [Clostridia bacterium]|nr:hypothetical protein [Clostridia bacterium]